MLKKFNNLLIILSLVINAGCSSNSGTPSLNSRVDNGVVIFGGDTAEDNKYKEQKDVTLVSNKNVLMPLNDDGYSGQLGLFQFDDPSSTGEDQFSSPDDSNLTYALRANIHEANKYLLNKIKQDDKNQAIAIVLAENRAFKAQQANRYNKNKKTNKTKVSNKKNNNIKKSKITMSDLKAEKLSVIMDTYSANFDQYATEEQLQQLSKYIAGALRNKPESQANLGDFYIDGLHGESYEELALSWYLIAAINNSTYAKYMLSILYEQGVTVNQDLEQSVAWYKKAENSKDNSYAKLRVAKRYLNIHSLFYNDKLAVMWLELAAKQNNIEAQFLLADQYLKGRGVAKSEINAIKWYGKAAANGSAYAQYSLGVMYYNGQGVDQNLLDAQKWLTMAAFNNHHEAQYLLGRMYEQGFGMQRDRPTAYALWRLIPKGDIVNDEMDGKMRWLIKNMTPAERIVAEKLSNQFKQRVMKRA